MSSPGKAAKEALRYCAQRGKQRSGPHGATPIRNDRPKLTERTAMHVPQVISTTRIPLSKRCSSAATRKPTESYLRRRIAKFNVRAFWLAAFLRRLLIAFQATVIVAERGNQAASEQGS
jgi:hypothetical protein